MGKKLRALQIRLWTRYIVYMFFRYSGWLHSRKTPEQWSDQAFVAPCWILVGSLRMHWDNVKRVTIYTVGALCCFKWGLTNRTPRKIRSSILHLQMIKNRFVSEGLSKIDSEKGSKKVPPKWNSPVRIVLVFPESLACPRKSRFRCFAHWLSKQDARIYLLSRRSWIMAAPSGEHLWC